MTKSTRTAIVVSVAYFVIAYQMFDSVDGGADWNRVLFTPVFFLPLLILWGWWFYKRGGRN